MSLKVYAPASIGNVSVGFDLLGAALAPVEGTLLGDTVTIETLDSYTQEIELTLSGCWADKLPADPKQNIVWQCADFFLRAQKIQSAIRLHLDKNLPVGSGLGSSASSVVAAFYALNEYFDTPYSPQKLLGLMGQFEGKVSGAVHYDNLAPCYLGGMQLILNQKNRLCEPLPIFKDWYWVVAYSGVSLATSQMRQLLPVNYDQSTCVNFGRHLATYVHACYRDDADLALSVLKDVLAEPYRASKVTGFIPAKIKLQALGMDAVGISGSGPTLFAVCRDRQLAKQAMSWLSDHYLVDGGFVHLCQLDFQGARRISDAVV